MEITITLTINGEQRTVKSDPQRPLLDVLREDLHLTGTKYGCGQARCGACTVLIDGKPVRSCSRIIADAQGSTVTTIEGLAQGQTLHLVQEAFLTEGAMQCGYCTPGMVLRTLALLKMNPNPSDAMIQSWMNGHLCRCNGYTKILNAIRRAARRMSEATIS